MKRLGPILAVTVLAAALAASRFGNGYEVYVLGLLAATVIVAIGLNILLGLCGLVSLGHVAFFSIGSYATAILTGPLGFWPALVVAGALAAAVGAVLALPALRTSGPYLAMVTIAFAFVIEHGAVEWREVTGGANGLMGFPAPRLFGVSLAAQDIATGLVVTAALAMLFFARLAHSGWGYAMRAVRDAAVAAQSIGIDPLRVRMAAFTLSAALAGIAGGWFSPLNGFISPEAFPLIQSIVFLLVVIVGGAGSLWGPVVGAIIVAGVPEAMASLAEYRLMFVGLLLVIVLLVAPHGLVGTIQRLVRRAPAVQGRAASFDLAGFAGGASGRDLTVKGLSVSFGGIHAVCDVAFEARCGAVTSLIGPNGAGKTTALNLIAGFYTPDTGTVRIGAEDVTGASPFRIARAGIARTYQTSQLFGELTVLENVAIALRRGRLGSPIARALSVAQRETAEGLLGFVGYRGALDARAGALPHVDRRLVEIARALAIRPAVLLLDEPAAGLDAGDTRAIAALLRRIADAGIAVLVVEHDMDLVMGVSDHIVVLDGGRCIAARLPAAIRDDARVRKAYLGDGAFALPPRVVPRTGGRDNLLSIGALAAGYGGAPVLRGLEMNVSTGETVAVLGPNGAGKSTLMAALSGTLRPVGGAVELGGTSIETWSAHKVARAGLVLVPEGRQVFPELTVRDNLLLGAFARNDVDADAEIADLIRRFPPLAARLHQRAGLLSGGEQQMLAIARGLIARPRVLLLDEPSLGLAPQMLNALYGEIAALRDEGRTILLVDQMAELALGVVDRAYVVQSGRVVRSGAAADLRADPELAQAYFGEEPVLAHADS